MFDENVWCVYEIQLSTSSFMTSEIWPSYNVPFAHVFLIRRSEKICLQATFFNVFQNNKKKKNVLKLEAGARRGGGGGYNERSMKAQCRSLRKWPQIV